MWVRSGKIVGDVVLSDGCKAECDAFIELTSTDEDIEWDFIPVGMRTKEDPLGRRGYVVWRIFIDGKFYGAVEEIDRESHLPTVVEKCRAKARETAHTVSRGVK